MTRHGLLGLVRADVRAKAEWVYGSSGARNILKALFTDGTFAMVVYRLMQASHRWHLFPLVMFFNKLNAIAGRCVIGRSASFGPGFVLVHSDGVFINSAVQAGCNVKIEHQVTIGAERGAIPRLGDDIFIGAGARVLGGIRVGNRVNIGANAVVLEDVPDDTTAVGVPARMVRRGGRAPASAAPDTGAGGR